MGYRESELREVNDMRFDPANLRDWARALPDLVQLIWRVVRDPRVPSYLRVGLVALCAYLVLPIDIVPDWVPLAGQVDDLLIATIGLRVMLRRVPQQILLEHWTGNAEMLEGILATEISPEIASRTTTGI